MDPLSWQRARHKSRMKSTLSLQVRAPSRVPTLRVAPSDTRAAAHTDSTVLHNNLGGKGCNKQEADDARCDETTPSGVCDGQTIEGDCSQAIGALQCPCLPSTHASPPSPLPLAPRLR